MAHEGLPRPVFVRGQSRLTSPTTTGNRRVKACLDWANSCLRRAGFDKTIVDLQADLQDGVLLASMVEAIVSREVTGIVPPFDRHAKTSNIQNCLLVLKEHGVDTSGISVQDVFEGNANQILDLFLAMSKHKQDQRPQSKLTAPQSGIRHYSSFGHAKVSSTPSVTIGDSTPPAAASTNGPSAAPAANFTKPPPITTIPGSRLKKPVAIPTRAVRKKAPSHDGQDNDANTPVCGENGALNGALNRANGANGALNGALRAKLKSPVVSANTGNQPPTSRIAQLDSPVTSTAATGNQPLASRITQLDSAVTSTAATGIQPPTSRITQLDSAVTSTAATGIQLPTSRIAQLNSPITSTAATGNQPPASRTAQLDSPVTSTAATGIPPSTAATGNQPPASRIAQLDSPVTSTAAIGIQPPTSRIAQLNSPITSTAATGNQPPASRIAQLDSPVTSTAATGIQPPTSRIAHISLQRRTSGLASPSVRNGEAQNRTKEKSELTTRKDKMELNIRKENSEVINKPPTNTVTEPTKPKQANSEEEISPPQSTPTSPEMSTRTMQSSRIRRPSPNSHTSPLSSPETRKRFGMCNGTAGTIRFNSLKSPEKPSQAKQAKQPSSAKVSSGDELAARDVQDELSVLEEEPVHITAVEKVDKSSEQMSNSENNPVQSSKQPLRSEHIADGSSSLSEVSSQSSSGSDTGTSSETESPRKVDTETTESNELLKMRPPLSVHTQPSTSQMSSLAESLSGRENRLRSSWHRLRSAGPRGGSKPSIAASGSIIRSVTIQSPGPYDSANSTPLSGSPPSSFNQTSILEDNSSTDVSPRPTTRHNSLLPNLPSPLPVKSLVSPDWQTARRPIERSGSFGKSRTTFRSSARRHHSGGDLLDECDDITPLAFSFKPAKTAEEVQVDSQESSSDETGHTGARPRAQTMPTKPTSSAAKYAVWKRTRAMEASMSDSATNEKQLCAGEHDVTNQDATHPAETAGPAFSRSVPASLRNSPLPQNHAGQRMVMDCSVSPQNRRVSHLQSDTSSVASCSSAPASPSTEHQLFPLGSPDSSSHIAQALPLSTSSSKRSLVDQKLLEARLAELEDRNSQLQNELANTTQLMSTVRETVANRDAELASVLQAYKAKEQELSRIQALLRSLAPDDWHKLSMDGLESSRNMDSGVDSGRNTVLSIHTEEQLSKAVTWNTATLTDGLASEKMVLGKKKKKTWLRTSLKLGRNKKRSQGEVLPTVEAEDGIENQDVVAVQAELLATREELNQLRIAHLRLLSQGSPTQENRPASQASQATNPDILSDGQSSDIEPTFADNPVSSMPDRLECSVSLMCHRHTVAIGTIQVAGSTSWQRLDNEAVELALRHCREIDPSKGLGLTSSSVVSYTINGHSRRPGEATPDTDVPFILLNNQDSKRELIITLAGAHERSCSQLAYETLIPQHFLERYVGVLQQQQPVVLAGPVSSGKSFLAKKLIQHLLERNGLADDDILVTTPPRNINSPEHLEEHLQGVVQNYRERHERGAESPRGIIIEDLEMACLDRRTLSNLHQPGQTSRPYVIVTSLLWPTTPVDRGSSLPASFCGHIRLVPHHEPLEGLLARFLKRQVAQYNRRMDGVLLHVADWLPDVWKHINSFLEAVVSPQVVLGPGRFMSCPMDGVEAECWFVSLWNYYLMPYAVEAASWPVPAPPNVQPWYNPLAWLLETLPWSHEEDEHGATNWPVLEPLRREDMVWHPTRNTSQPKPNGNGALSQQVQEQHLIHLLERVVLNAATSTN